jgi:hypothetical protein
MLWPPSLLRGYLSKLKYPHILFKDLLRETDPRTEK